MRDSDAWEAQANLSLNTGISEPLWPEKTHWLCMLLMISRDFIWANIYTPEV